jgi:dsDNA-specific endonuclease/ATPase MutS2
MSESEYIDPFNPFPEPVEIEITDSIDLHSFQPRDVKSVVETYLREARAKGFRTVRIIHGKGIGVQREIVRKILSETEFVKSFKNGDEFSGGGAGATIVYFKD